MGPTAVPFLVFFLASSAFGGCFGSQVIMGGPAAVERAPDVLADDRPVTIEEIGPEHRRYHFSLGAMDLPGGYMPRFMVVADSELEVVWNWTVQYRTTGRQDECSALAVGSGFLGTMLPDSPSTGSIHWTEDTTMGVTVAGGGLQGSRLLDDSEAVTKEDNGEWRIPAGNDLIAELGSTRGSSDWAIFGDPREHAISITLDVRGTSHVVHHEIRDSRFFECGTGTDNIGSKTIETQLGPAQLVALEDVGSESASRSASLLYRNAMPIPAVQSVRVTFGDDTQENPTLVARTSYEPQAAVIEFLHWAEWNGDKPQWFVSNTYWPWLEDDG